MTDPTGFSGENPGGGAGSEQGTENLFTKPDGTGTQSNARDIAQGDASNTVTVIGTRDPLQAQISWSNYQRTLAYLAQQNRVAMLMRQIARNRCGGSGDGLCTTKAKNALSQFVASAIEEVRGTLVQMRNDLKNDLDDPLEAMQAFPMGGPIIGGFAREAKFLQGAVEVEDAAQLAKPAIGATGKVGEDALKLLGGESQVYFRTSQGGRYIDQLVNGAANESKVGYTSLTADIRLQIAKDFELMQTKQITGATWHFFVSPVTGLGGASQPLINLLQQSGINVVIH